MLIPPIDPSTGNLSPGVHEATWEEVAARYGYNAHRLRLLAGLLAALQALRTAGCRRAYIDGSFVGAKEEPADFDGCWESDGVDLQRLDPVLQTFADRRRAQKEKYGGELFVAEWEADLAGTRFIDFFQQDKGTGREKGIVAIDLGGLP